MSLKTPDIIHTRAEAVEALKVIAARHGRTLKLDNSGPDLGAGARNRILRSAKR